MFCNNCGAELSPRSKFCGKCGTAIDSVTKRDALELEQDRRNQQSQRPQSSQQSSSFESDNNINQARKKSSRLPFSFIWIVSTILTGIIIQRLSSFFDFAIFSWGMLFVLPVGAIATAYLNLFLFNLSCRIFRIKPQGNLFFNATLSTFIIILMLANTDPAQTELVIRYRSAVSGGVNIPPFWGWVLRITKIIGFWLTSIGSYEEVVKGLKN